MSAHSFALFDTALGSCGIAWGDAGIAAVQLPDARKTQTRARLRQQFPAVVEKVPTRPVQLAIDHICALLRGDKADLSDIVLDMSEVPPFHQRVYLLARSIEPGVTLTYGELAKQLGSVGLARAVGQALGKNPFAVVVPCHRVLAAGGKMGGFSAGGGVITKQRMLDIEGATIPTAKTPTGRAEASLPLFDGDGCFDFDADVAVRYLRSNDVTLARLMDRVGPFRMELKTATSIFGALAEAIVYQQLNGKVAATIYGRVCALFPNPRKDSTLQAFAPQHPTPQQILGAPDEKLRGAGLSQAKMLALRDLAQKVGTGVIPTLSQAGSIDNETLIETLSSVRGVGRWTAEMLLMFRLGRGDVLPVDDFGVRKGYMLAWNCSEMPTRKELEIAGEVWKPYRTVASWYLWRATDSAGLN
jgi:O-6-methylguanine DNA methyltransferase